MSTTLDGIDIIDIRVNVFVEVRVVNHGHLNRRTIFIGIEVNHLADERRTGTVDITHELTQTLLRVERLLLAVTLCVNHTLIFQHNPDTCIEECQLTHTVGENLPVINGLGEDTVVRPELHERTGFALFPVTGCLLLRDRMYRSYRFTFLVVLTVNSTLTIHLYVHALRQRVHAAYTHTVQTTGHFIRILVELTTGVEHRHNDFQRTLVLLRMHVYRNTTTVILNGDGVVLIDMNGYLVAESRERLINRVIDYLINKMVQTLLRYIANIHRRSFTHRL